MIPLTLSEVQDVLRGTSDAPPPPRTVSRVSTDTRSVGAGDLFVALRGGRFDAHDFLARAEHAAAAVVERVPAGAPPGLPLIVVADARRALGDLARFHRETLRNTTVVAVAGSNGKTGTKALIHAALRATLRGTASPASFNNDVGVPMTLLPIDPADDYAVVEIGTNAPGEVAYLTDVARPDVAVVTSIGEEHLEGLGDLDGVRRENAAVARGGLLVVNAEDGAFVELCRRTACELVTFGPPGSDLVASDVACDAAGTSFRLDGRRFRVPAIGPHHATNALAAVAVARRMGVADDAVAAGLADAEPPAMRMERTVVAGVTLLNDAYNANPASVRAALDALRAFPCDGRRAAILGEMRELGDAAERYHREVGERAAGLGRVFCVGDAARPTAAAGGGEWFAEPAEAAEAVASWARAGDVVLFKASRGARLERAVAGVVGRLGGGSAGGTLR